MQRRFLILVLFVLLFGNSFKIYYSDAVLPQRKSMKERNMVENKLLHTDHTHKVNV